MSKLYLIPSPVAEDNLQSLSSEIASVVKHLRFFLVEDEKIARRFLKKLFPDFPLAECQLFPLNEHTSAIEAQIFFESVKEHDVGIISDAGCPCVADPGANIVLAAHKAGMEVVPLVGPSSILLALMASGLNGQNFAFVGYLPKDKHERNMRIKQLEKRVALEQQTQIFMETPYRNQSLFEELLQICHPQMYLTVAIEATAVKQFFKTQTIAQWQKTKMYFEKKPALFLIGISK